MTEQNDVFSSFSKGDDETIHDETIQKALAGDLVSFEELVRRHQGGIRGFLLARLSRREDAEDLAQEVFITAYKRRKTFSGEVKIESWLRGIARNLMLNHIRKFRAKPIGGNDELQALVDQELDHVGHEGEVILALRECLAELDGPARGLMTSRYLDGVSVRQLEEKTGRGYSALTMQLHRIRTRLAKCIEAKVNYLPGQ